MLEITILIMLKLVTRVYLRVQVYPITIEARQVLSKYTHLIIANSILPLHISSQLTLGIHQNSRHEITRKLFSHLQRLKSTNRCQNKVYIEKYRVALNSRRK
jgi:hypothetical protein